MSHGGPYRLPPIVPVAPRLPAEPTVRKSEPTVRKSGAAPAPLPRRVAVQAPSAGSPWLLPLVGVGLVVAWLLGFLAGAWFAGGP